MMKSIQLLRGLIGYARVGKAGLFLFAKKNFEKSFFNFTAADKIFNYSSTKYNLYCYFSLSGNKTKALELLEQALIKNFSNFDHIQKDTDFGPIRKELKFEKILKKYFPHKI